MRRQQPRVACFSLLGRPRICDTSLRRRVYILMISIYPMFPFTDEKAAASGGLFQFMRKTKNMRHKPEEEGIYLDDLNISYVSFHR